MAILAANADIRTMKIGDEISLQVFPQVTDAKISRGKIIYIDKKLRFFRAEFTVYPNGNIIRESFAASGQRCTKEGKDSAASKVL